ncbi:glutaminyl-peptide cyclotransferase (plasmid) [Haladaptatus sp. SPP-AMP-3]|uniref:bifunctional YncE family protein/alkaline phosphatase family protein n=1 Tax=Haladaptatus sp. SPP-AMP-3 TaxID=3121295 RepID=UPI003C2DE98E
MDATGDGLSDGTQGEGDGFVPHSPGWTLTPAGEQTEVGDRPMGAALSPNGKYLAVSNDGQGVQSMMLVDVSSNEVVDTIQYETPEALFVGVEFASNRTLYASAGTNNKIRVYSVGDGTLTEGDSIRIGPEDEQIFPAGLTVSSDGARLYVATNLNNAVAVVDLCRGEVVESISVGNKPYTVELSRNGKKAYVSNWGADTLSVIDTDDLEVTKAIQVGGRPNDVLLSPTRSRLYTSSGNADTVSIIDTKSDEVVETLDLEPYEDAPTGSMPNALAVSPNGETLYVANAGNNDVAVVELGKPGCGNNTTAEIAGLIPTAWFPSALAVTNDDRYLFVANMKGLGAEANPNGPNPAKGDYSDNGVEGVETQYIGNMISGTLSKMSVPKEKQLAKYTDKVVENNGFSEMTNELVHTSEDVTPQPVPRRVGDPSPIDHVIYIIKENRTYDQILGDIDAGNGDPSLTLFGPESAPNHHALAKEFVLLDNFYVDAEVSADGHNWSVGAIANDYTQKTWPSNYGGRGRNYDFENGGATRPKGGYLWNMAAASGVSYRSYGEFANNKYDDDGSFDHADPSVSGLEGHVDPDYPSYDLEIKDITRFGAWLKEFRAYEDDSNDLELPELTILRFPNDHTAGTTPGMPTPQAMMADNDLAVGKLVETVTNSSYWEDTAIFITEDDAQNGPDHVDAHRSLTLVASPYTRRGVVDSTFYSTVSVLRSIELMLGMPPLTQFDARATPMINAFIGDDEPALDYTYEARVPEQSLDETNTEDSSGAQASKELDLDEEDEAKMQKFNRIIWHAVKGADVPMPEPKTTFRSNASPQSASAMDEEEENVDEETESE